MRESESVQGGYSISLRANDIIYHYRISTEFDLFFISPSSKFNSLVELVRHHSSQADGLIIPLKFPIPNSHHNQRRNHYARPDQWEIDRQDVRIQAGFRYFCITSKSANFHSFSSLEVSLGPVSFSTFETQK